jgi:hypothetical protein
MLQARERMTDPQNAPPSISKRVAGMDSAVPAMLFILITLFIAVVFGFARGALQAMDEDNKIHLQGLQNLQRQIRVWSQPLPAQEHAANPKMRTSTSDMPTTQTSK